MSAKSRSISQKLKKIKSPEDREAIFHEWLLEIESMTRKITFNLESAIERHDMQMIEMQAVALRELTERKIFAIKDVVKAAYNPVKIKSWPHDKEPRESLGALVVELGHGGIEPMILGVNDFTDGQWDKEIKPHQVWCKEDDVLLLIDKGKSNGKAKVQNR